MSRAALAALIFEYLPRNRKTYPADQLALLLLLEDAGVPQPLHVIRDAFGVPTATASDLVSRAVRAGRVERVRARRDGRLRLVQITPRGKRELYSSRRYTP